MGYAAYTKGTTALLTAILGMVEKEGVQAELAGRGVMPSLPRPCVASAPIPRRPGGL